MKSIPKNSQVKGLYVYCNGCKRRSKTTLPKNHCTHPDDKVGFRAHFHVPGERKPIVRVLKANNLQDAIIEKVQLEKQLKANNYAIPIKKAVTKKPPIHLLPCIVEYVRYLDNIGVYEHQKKNLSAGFKNQQRRYLERFVDSLAEKKIPVRSIRLNDINGFHAEVFHNYLIPKGFANRTYNRHMDTVSEFFNYFIKIRGYKLTNFFLPSSVKRKPVVAQKDAVSIKDFQRLLSLINKENEVETLSTGEKKYHYQEWLKDAFELALLTGGRRDEIILMKFSDIIEKDGKLICIRTEDYKYNKNNDLVKDYEKKYIESPIIYELGLVLQKLGYNKFKDTDRYIIAGDSKLKRDTLKEKMSKAFTHYYKQLGNEKNLQFRNLRKTYVTLINNFTNGNGEVITGHSGQGIIRKSYHDQKVFNHVLDNFRMIS